MEISPWSAYQKSEALRTSFYIRINIPLRRIKPGLFDAPVIRQVLAYSIHPRSDMLTEANIQNYFNMNIKELNNYLQSLPENNLRCGRNRGGNGHGIL